LFAFSKAKGTLSLSDSYVFARVRVNPESKEALETNDRAKEIAATFKDAPNCLYLGRGYNFPLHLKELLNLKRYLIFMLKGTQAEMKQANCFN
jgi:glucosamine--fructose-6-phosphate aminotransferase (isomerizing)